MKNLLLLYFVFTTGIATGQEYWQQKVDHIIDVKLNAAEKTLDGFEKITYTNNSPDTLHFIWFHLWPNAYKTDQTAFSNQQLENGQTEFYFATKEQRGYINRLDFKVAGVPARTEDHPEHIDIVKLLLPQPLLPGQATTITTPFHVKLPYNFSRSGFAGKSFQVTQWYPKPATYDATGWHPMPYLDQGEFYNEFGDYKVSITVPKHYVVAATGVLQEEEEKLWLSTRKDYQPATPAAAPKKYSKKPLPKMVLPVTATEYKTISFLQQNVHDFAWFADPDFIVQQDTCALPSGKIIGVAGYYTPKEKGTWKNAVAFAKDAVRFYSEQVGEYPYNVLTVVQGPQAFGGGMEYPTITVIAPAGSAKDLDVVIAHEVGHNWFQGVLASNERLHPWMDEGINSFYEKKYTQLKYGAPSSEEKILLHTQVRNRKDQPITTEATGFSYINYALVAYQKTALWMQHLESMHGEPLLQEAMQHYFSSWQFRHPQPGDFKKSMEEKLPGITAAFALLPATGLLPNQQLEGTAVVSPFVPGSIKKYGTSPSKNNIWLGPAIGFNRYDRFMIGAVVSNYLLPPARFRFLALPLYATGSKEWNGIGKLAYDLFPGRNKITLGIAALHFSMDQGRDSLGTDLYEDFSKITPSVRFTFAQPARSSKERWLEGRSWFITEKYIRSFVTAADGLLYADSMQTGRRYLNQLSFHTAHHRALYPYQLDLQLQQGNGWYRMNATGNYFFNYAKGGGAAVRLFAAAFGYTTSNFQKRFATTLYQPKLLGNTGEEDYTYSNYFIGRSASYAKDQSVVDHAGLAAQQIMIRDGGMKLRLDFFDFLQGRSDQWVAAVNFNTTLPKNILPVPLPLRLFLDVGTRAEAWKRDAEESRFLYVGGLQLTVYKILNIYAPIVYSKVFRDNLKALPEQNSFAKKLTFSIDIQNISVRSITNNQFSF